MTTSATASQVAAMYEIRITRPAETAECACTESGCGYCGAASGHAAVQQMWLEAVQHAMATGHPVVEHGQFARTVRARTRTDY